MSAITDLLSAAPEDFVRKMLPKGDYLCQIVEAELLHGFWKGNPSAGKKPRWFEAYVPTIEIIDYIPSGDDDIDAETLTALENFGDWKGYQPPNGSGHWVQMQQVPGFNDKIKCAGMAFGLNFILAETTPEWVSMIELASSAARFFTSQNARGEVDGWVVKTLSTDPESLTPPEIEANTSLPDIIERTKGCYLIVTIDHEQDEKGEYEPKVICDGTSGI